MRENFIIAEDTEGLVAAVVELTQPHATRDFVALYAYGSYARGETDPWSDVDLCFVFHPCLRGLANLRTWGIEMDRRFGYRVDPMGVALRDLSKHGHWNFAFLRRSLRRNSVLLLGRDIRPGICPPSMHHLRLSTLFTAYAYLRRVYGIPATQPFPEELRPPTLNADMLLAGGNIAWQMSGLVLQLMRTIILFETGIFCDSKHDIPPSLQRMGETRLLGYAEEAFQVRHEEPRFGPLQGISPRLRALGDCVPELEDRLFTAMRRFGLVDPSYEPPSGGLYTITGARRAA